MKNLKDSNYILDVRGEDIVRVDTWIDENLSEDDYAWSLMNVFPNPCYRYYFKCPHQHLMTILST